LSSKDVTKTTEYLRKLIRLIADKNKLHSVLMEDLLSAKINLLHC